MIMSPSCSLCFALLCMLRAVYLLPVFFYAALSSVTYTQGLLPVSLRGAGDIYNYYWPHLFAEVNCRTHSFLSMQFLPSFVQGWANLLTFGGMFDWEGLRFKLFLSPPPPSLSLSQGVVPSQLADKRESA